MVAASSLKLQDSNHTAATNLKKLGFFWPNFSTDCHTV